MAFAFYCDCQSTTGCVCVSGPRSAIITNVNSDEVWFKRLDGSKSKLYVSQLQKGKYTIKHS